MKLTDYQTGYLTSSLSRKNLDLDNMPEKKLKPKEKRSVDGFQRHERYGGSFPDNEFSSLCYPALIRDHFLSGRR